MSITTANRRLAFHKRRHAAGEYTDAKWEEILEAYRAVKAEIEDHHHVQGPKEGELAQRGSQVGPISTRHQDHGGLDNRVKVEHEQTDDEETMDEDWDVDHSLQKTRGTTKKQPSETDEQSEYLDRTPRLDYQSRQDDVPMETNTSPELTYFERMTGLLRALKEARG